LATKYPNVYHLDQKKYLIEDNPKNSKYFEIKGLPDRLGYGKHYFTITFKDSVGEQSRLRENSSILFEFKDSQGTVLFSDLTSYNDISGASIGYIWIKKDPLRTYEDVAEGVGYLTIVGELDNVPKNWQDVYNVKMAIPIDIRKDLANTSPILFQNPTTIQTNSSFSESIDIDGNSVHYTRSYLTVSASNLETYGGKAEFIELSYREQKAQNNEYKVLTTYPISSSVFEVFSGSAEGLNPVSDEQKIPTPREIRRGQSVDFRLRFLNLNSEYAQKIDTTNQDIEITGSIATFLGSPMIIEKGDNILSGSFLIKDKTNTTVGKIEVEERAHIQLGTKISRTQIGTPRGVRNVSSEIYGNSITPHQAGASAVTSKNQHFYAISGRSQHDWSGVNCDQKYYHLVSGVEGIQAGSGSHAQLAHIGVLGRIGENRFTEPRQWAGAFNADVGFGKNLIIKKTDSSLAFLTGSYNSLESASIYLYDENNNLNVSIKSSGIISASNISASTFYGDGSNLTGISAGGAIDISGTPVNNQLAVWTDADTLEGESELTYDDSQLNIKGNTVINSSNTAVADYALIVEADGPSQAKIFTDHTAGSRVVGLHLSASGNSTDKDYWVGLDRTDGTFSIKQGASDGAEVFNIKETGHISASAVSASSLHGTPFYIPFGGYTTTTTQNYYYVKNLPGAYYYWSANFGSGIGGESRGKVVKAANYIATGNCKLTKVQGYFYADSHADDCVIHVLTNDSDIPQAETNATIALTSIQSQAMVCDGSGWPQGFSWDISGSDATLKESDVVIFSVLRDSGTASTSNKRYYFNCTFTFEEL